MNLIPIKMEDYKLQLALIELKEELKDFKKLESKKI